MLLGTATKRDLVNPSGVPVPHEVPLLWCKERQRNVHFVSLDVANLTEPNYCIDGSIKSNYCCIHCYIHRSMKGMERRYPPDSKCETVNVMYCGEKQQIKSNTPTASKINGKVAEQRLVGHLTERELVSK